MADGSGDVRPCRDLGGDGRRRGVPAGRSLVLPRASPSGARSRPRVGPGRVGVVPAGSRRGSRRWLVVGRSALTILSALVLVVTGYGWSQYQNLADGIHRSDALSGAAHSPTDDTNILIMGLDSRLDENGNPLPADIYAALHTGDQQIGGYNANVLMLLHIPGNGMKATAISIPRDDYVSLAGSPDGTTKGKIKQAYGLAFDQEHTLLVHQGVTDKTTLEQRSRDAGRRTESDTVSQFLGGVPIDHFVEVTMVAFYQLAQVVAPITVCVNENTQDSYSGANFHAGQQQLNAAQALAFVRQRRDTLHPQLNFTDLDRERRQQAFIAALAYQLKQAGTLTDPTRLGALLDVAKQNIAVDSGLDLLALAEQATSLTNGNITFATLPIDHFGTDPLGEAVNIVNPTQVQNTARTLLNDTPPSTSPAPAASSPVDVVNATGRAGLAAAVERALGTAGYTPGVASNAGTHLTTTTIYYAPNAGDAAGALSALLAGAPTAADPALAPDHLRIVLGANFTMPSTLITSSSNPPNTTPTGQDGAANALANSISGGTIPCVK